MNLHEIIPKDKFTPGAQVRLVDAWDDDNGREGVVRAEWRPTWDPTMAFYVIDFPPNQPSEMGYDNWVHARPHEFELI